MIPSENAFKLAQKFEGCELTCYADPTGLATIGFGNTSTVLQSDIGIKTIPMPVAVQLLCDDMKNAGQWVNELIVSQLNQNQFDSLCDFVFNLGAHHFQNSTLLQYLNTNRFEDAANEFDKWIYAGGVIENGLIARRAAEKELFLEAV